MTNYEKIKNMSIDELAKYLCLQVHIIKGGSNCEDCEYSGHGICNYKRDDIKKYLNSEADT